MLRKSIFLLLTCAIAVAVQPGEPFKPGKLTPAEVAVLAPGLTLRFYAKANDAKALDARRVRVAAMHVPRDSPPSPFLAAGPVHAKLTGYLKNPLKGDYRFRLSGTGTMSLRINNKEVLTNNAREAEVELAKNYNRIEITYASPSTGDSTLRLDWSGEKFGFEPVPPDILFSRKDDADLVEQTALREGRQLYASLHCAGCHALPGKLGLKDCAMPEMQSSAPRLNNAGHRFNYDWLVAWILNPRALRPEATMPSMLRGPDAEKHAADIAAYLVSLKVGDELKPLNPAAKPDDGAALAKRLGCVTCHRPDDPQKADELGRLSLFFAGVKYAPNAIAHFLRKPHELYPWTRMPDFKLSDSEAGQLEAHIRDRAKGTVAAQTKGDAARGQLLFRKVGCLNCHQVNKNDEVKMAADIRAFDKGCLADKDHGTTPNFNLTEPQRNAMTLFLKSDGKSLIRETPAEFSLRQVKALRCDSCHRRDGEITRWHAILEDEGKLPENLPSLTWAGEKLKPTWTKKLIAGQSDRSARPWIKGRMPAFPARAEMLAVGLSHEHGFGIEDDDRPKPDATLAAVGEKLIPQQGGFNCINCHGIGRTPPIAPFEAPGINLLDAAIRLRYGYYQRWMLAPDRVDVTMRMPVFATDGKTTQIRDVFDGDARRQYDALWHYIQTLPAKSK
jgi:mono/diheme cytochrome c family protein